MKPAKVAMGRSAPALFTAAVLALGCETNTHVRTKPTTALIDAVAGDARASLASGTGFARVDAVAFGKSVTISSVRAALATAFVREYGARLQPEWARQYGAGIKAAQLNACGHVQFAEAAFQPFIEDVDATTRKAWGPRYLVQFCKTAGPAQVLVSVSALATDLAIAAGRLAPLSDLFVAIVSSAIPMDWEVPFGAETAAIAVAQATRARVVEVPRLVARADGGHALFGSWQVVVERPVRLRGAGTRREFSTDTVLLSDNGRHRSVLLKDTGPDASRSDVTFRTDRTTARGVGGATATLRVSPEAARNAELVEVLP